MSLAEDYRALVEQTLDEVLPRETGTPSSLYASLRYAVGSGGKRIRPLICLGSSVAVGGSAADARYPAAAIELLHNYTLIHDDLPAMDNDVERRGQPTVWKKFGEADAILAGDALQAQAFRVAAQAPRQVGEIVRVLGEKGLGVVAGQVADLRLAARRGTSPVSAAEVDFVYTHKTADLFIAAAEMGAWAGGGDEKMVAALGTFALNLGLAFQYEDDLLDGDAPFDRAEMNRLILETTDAAKKALTGLPGDCAFLLDLADQLVGRKV